MTPFLERDPLFRLKKAIEAGANRRNDEVLHHALMWVDVLPFVEVDRVALPEPDGRWNWYGV